MSQAKPPIKKSISEESFKSTAAIIHSLSEPAQLYHAVNSIKIQLDAQLAQEKSMLAEPKEDNFYDWLIAQEKLILEEAPRNISIVYSALAEVAQTLLDKLADGSPEKLKHLWKHFELTKERYQQGEAKNFSLRTLSLPEKTASFLAESATLSHSESPPSSLPRSTAMNFASLLDSENPPATTDCETDSSLSPSY